MFTKDAMTGIRVATSWYNSHIDLAHPPIRGRPKKALPSVVLMTEDMANYRKAQNAGIPSVTGESTTILCGLFLTSVAFSV
jgi:hypothetical protein